MFIAILAITLTLNGYGQFSFSVSPGLTTNSAYFGYNIGKVVPYAGLQLASGIFNGEEKDHYFDGTEWITDIDSRSVNVNLFMPTVGVKIFAIETGDLKAYFNLAGSKPMLMGKMKEDGNEIEDFSDELKKIKVIGAELGFGVEYFLSRNFSIGGEYSIRYLGGNTKTVWEDTWHGEINTYTNTMSLGIVPTIAKFSLNYYFGGGAE